MVHDEPISKNQLDEQVSKERVKLWRVLLLVVLPAACFYCRPIALGCIIIVTTVCFIEKFRSCVVAPMGLSCTYTPSWEPEGLKCLRNPGFLEWWALLMPFPNSVMQGAAEEAAV